MKITIYINLLSIVLIFYYSCSSKNKENFIENESQAQSALTLNEEQIKTNGIKFGKAKLRAMEFKIMVTGIIHALPQNKASVHSKVEGFIGKINYISGDYVRKGQVLATVSNPSFIILQKQFLESYYNMNLAYKDYLRKKALLESDAISRKSYEQSLALYQVSTAEYESHKSELQLLGFTPNAIIKTGKINPELKIISPLNGFIQAKEISPGKQITTMDELFLIINQDKIYVELNVPSKYASTLYMGQKIEFTWPDIKDTIKGVLHNIGKVTNTENNTIQVHADIQTKLPATNFYENRFVNAYIISENSEVLTVPKEAVYEEEGKNYVYSKKGDQVERKEIITGISNTNYIEVKNLDPNQEIVICGAYYLQSGEMEPGHNH
ncbi:MAG: efflux RND transporter periplasmic adaptor subunit [Apibacter sp.]|jgi:membrane fusion protein, heavy metal efflux system|nr:efflux RND transporter periplasmic adaptor subunit [Apibacter sp.]